MGKNFVDDVGIDLAIIFELGQCEQLARIISMAIIGADHETILTGVLEHVRQIVIRLTRDE